VGGAARASRALENVLIFVWHCLQMAIAVSPRTQITPGAAYGVEQALHVGMKELPHQYTSASAAQAYQ
jgi:hypothetical protein